jgi:hypothetical protein
MINIHVTVGSNSIPYYEYLRQNYTKTANKHELVFHAYCLDDRSYDAMLNMSAHRYRVDSANGTEGHCNAIKVALKSFSVLESDCANIIADADTVMLVKGWDEIVISILENVGMFGSSYEEIGGKCSGNGLIQTYKNKPSATWVATSTKYDFSKLETEAFKHNHLKIKDEKMSTLYNLPIGYSLLRDTGWQIPSYLDDHKIPYNVLKQCKHDSGAKVLKTGYDYHEEYQHNNEPFMGHQRGSLSKVFRQDKLSKAFYDVVDKHISDVVKC